MSINEGRVGNACWLRGIVSLDVENINNGSMRCLKLDIMCGAIGIYKRSVETI
jgi:hypothetical protein